MSAERANSTTSRARITLTSAVLILLAAAAGAESLRAQQALATPASARQPEQRLHDEEPSPDLAAARALEALRDWRGAASHYERAAELRAPSDPRAIDELTSAANLYYFAKDLKAAARLLEEAGARALESGDGYRAAVSLHGAAVLHAKRMKPVTSQQLLRQACELAASLELSQEQRQTLQAKIWRCDLER